MSGSFIPPSGSGGANVPAPRTDATGTTGGQNGCPVVPQDAVPEHGGIDPHQGADTALGERRVSQPDDQPRPQIPTPENPEERYPKTEYEKKMDAESKAREGNTLKELETEQETLFEEVKEKRKKVEQHSVLGKALAALENPQNAEKGVKVSIHLPGEEEPLQLIPFDKKNLEGRDIHALMQQAKNVLLSFKTDNFVDFDPGKFNERINTIRESLEDINKKISKKGKSDNNFQSRFEDLQQRQETIIAYEKAPDGENADAATTASVQAERINPNQPVAPQPDPAD